MNNGEIVLSDEISDKFKIGITNNEGIITTENDIYFKPGSFELKIDGNIDFNKTTS